jgi:uncharacterized protein YeeX (DUF496 family)
MKFRGVNWDYDDVSLSTLDQEYGSSFSSPQIKKYNKEEEEMEFQRRATQKHITLQKIEKLQSSHFHTLGMRKNLEIQNTLLNQGTNELERPDRNLPYKFIRWSQMYLEKIQKLRVLSRSKIPKQAEYARSDLEFNKSFFQGTNVSISLICFKIFRNFIEIDEEEMNQLELNRNQFETRKVDKTYQPRNSDIFEVDDQGNLLGMSKINAYVQDPNDSLLNKTNMTFSRKPHHTEMIGRKEDLINEIQGYNRKINDKKQAVLLMTGLMRALDEYLQPVPSILDKQRVKLNKYRGMIEDEEILR